MAVARLLQPFRGRWREDRLELFMQAELLAQRLAKLVVIVDDEDFAGVAHGRPWPVHCRPGVVRGGRPPDKPVARPPLARKRAHGSCGLSDLDRSSCGARRKTAARRGSRSAMR